MFGLFFVPLVADSSFVETCSGKYNLNVVLLQDDVYEWSVQFVRKAVESAIKKNNQLNAANGISHVIMTNRHTVFCRH